MKLIFPNLTYQKIGGAENMVYEIAKVAYRNKNITSILIGNSKSLVAKRLTEDKIPFIFLPQDQLDLGKIDNSKDNLLINFHYFNGFSKLRELEAKSIIWGILAPQVTEWNGINIKKHWTGRKEIGDIFTRKLLANMHKKNSFISMDGATSDAINDFMGEKREWPTISIPVDINDARNLKKKVSLAHCLQISYIGRSDDVWKIKPVKKFIQDLNKIKNKLFNIHIYTDNMAPFLGELKDVRSEHVSVEYHTGLYGPLIRSHLNEHSDLHISMGTAALEGGLAGLPTILIDASPHDFPENYRYRWLFQTERNSLGRFIGADESGFFGMTMEEVVETCFDERARTAAAEDCIQYVLENHSALKITEKLLAHPVQATMKDICRFTPATWRSVSTVKAFFSRN